MGNEREMDVLLATDGSKNAQRATEWLTRLPLASTTSVLVVSVAPLPVLSTGIPSTRDLEEFIVARVQAGDARRDGAGPRVVEGDPREMILSVAAEWRAQLLVLGLEGSAR